MNKPTHTVLFLAIMFVLNLAMFLIQSHLMANRDREISRVTFGDKTQEVAYIPEPATQQRLKLIRFAKDGITQLSGTIYWNSGLIEDLTFTKNIVVSSVEYYPLDDKVGDAHMIRGAKRAVSKFADGVTYTYHAVYRPDGTLERVGKLLQAGGSYQSLFYFEDGKTVSRERIFDGQKHFRQEKIYRPDGSLVASIYSKAGDFNKTETALYRDDGTLYADFTRDPIDGEKGHVYTDDGKSMILEYVRDYYSLQEIFLDPQGNLMQNRDGSRMGGLLTVRGYKSVNGKMLMQYRQRWTLSQTIGPEANKHRLLRVEYFDFAASQTCEIQMDVAGTTITSVTCQQKNGSATVQRLSSDGTTVQTIDRVSKSGKTISTVRGNGKTISFPDEWLKDYRPTPLPEWKDTDAPPPVYDFH